MSSIHDLKVCFPCLCYCCYCYCCCPFQLSDVHKLQPKTVPNPKKDNARCTQAVCSVPVNANLRIPEHSGNVLCMCVVCIKHVASIASFVHPGCGQTTRHTIGVVGLGIQWVMSRATTTHNSPHPESTIPKVENAKQEVTSLLAIPVCGCRLEWCERENFLFFVCLCSLCVMTDGWKQQRQPIFSYAGAAVD